MIKNTLLLYADDTRLIFHHKDITEDESTLNMNVSMLCDWFGYNKLSIHFDEDKTKYNQDQEVKTTKHAL